MSEQRPSKDLTTWGDPKRAPAEFNFGGVRYVRGDIADRQEEALQRIQQWSEAYPLDVFPEPDLKRSAQVLNDAGLSLDRISAKAMRHVITQVQTIVDGVLSRPAQPPGDG